jgi:hypothetical protein
MTPQERQLIDGLFDRLAQLEGTPRDADAERAIAEGVGRAPNALYPLVQTVLVQDEALRRADARIRELGGGEQPAPAGGFLDNMRSILTGRPALTSVPSTGEPDPRYAAPAVGGGSFLGTAAASAAGVIGGALLLNSIGSLFGRHGSASAFDTVPPGDRWNPEPRNDLTREASFDDGDNDFGDTGDPGGDFGDFGGDGGVDT